MCNRSQAPQPKGVPQTSREQRMERRPHLHLEYSAPESDVRELPLPNRMCPSPVIALTAPAPPVSRPFQFKVSASTAPVDPSPQRGVVDPSLKIAQLPHLLVHPPLELVGLVLRIERVVGLVELV
ncbi:hypothetical protein QAD02_020002 [Eretmocerus hayati]|uniref:Uncharacterized protein n=1 Tax=Eretmocerus hayati TaxID=131215 RepID=A0ACC2PQZ7_9HYME|nr:hypothetical protein QAD02_020002 [Eretmocerus hayati]